MSARSSIDLYELLPVLYRLRDVEQRYPLRALLQIIGEQADIVERDIDALWDDYFIETCADWAIPYIGDLVANNPLYEVTGRRADVANTIYYRRRKGTLPMLEELARNVTDWGAHAVAFFELLGWTQNLNHLRYQMTPNPEDRDPNAVVDRVGTVNLRSIDALDRLDGPFDVVAHTVDVRPMGRTEGWYNIRKVGFFLWRLRRYPLTGISPHRADQPHDYGYHFSSLGNPAPLFTDPERETDEAGLAREVHVPGPIRPAAFYFDTEAYYGPGRSVHIVKDGNPVPATDILCKDLRNWDQPPEGKVAVDVHLGRLAFREDEKPDAVEVSYNYGFSADIGGGPYSRLRPHPPPDQPEAISTDTVADPEALDALTRVPSSNVGTITEALEAWVNAARPRAVIQIEDNRTYPEDLTINLDGDAELVIQAENRKRPTLVGNVTVTGGSDQARLVLNGLLVEGYVEVEGELGELGIEHCTLVPGRSLDEEGRPREPTRPSLIVGDANDRLRLVIERSIVGPLRLPTEMVGLEVGDSIIEGGRADIRPALVFSPLDLGSDTPTIHVTIGGEGPYRAVLPEGELTTAAQVRDPLERAIQGAHESPAFRNTRVITVPGIERLIVLSGSTDAVTIEEDRTAGELGFRVNALVGRPLPSFSGLSSGGPTVTLTLGDEGPHDIVLREDVSEPITTVVRARNSLQRAIRSVPQGSMAFSDALVGDLEDRLVVLPGTGGVTASFGATSDDQTTLLELGLESGHPAIAASDDGERPGPPTTLRRTTVLGAVYVNELSLASEVIFIAPVMARRRQSGCARFSYVPEGSQTPQRYRCQPDLALTQRAQELGLASEEDLPLSERTRIGTRLRPSFTSVHYGDPGYAQLGLSTAEELRTGAENGSEMGAFSHLKQPQREANLRIRLEEYLPFGLEAGLIYVT